MQILYIERNKLSEGIEAIENVLARLRMPRREIVKCLIAVEDVLNAMLARSTEDTAQVKVQSFLGNISVSLRMKGESFALEDIRPFCSEDEDDPDMQRAVNRYSARVLGEGIEIANSRGVNACSIRVRRMQNAALVKNLSALALGLLIGLLLKRCLPSGWAAAVSSNVFAPVSTMFMNALKMIVGPLIFFSMASSIADASDLRVLGKMVAKLIIGYLLTSAVAIGVGYGVYQLFPIGDPSMAALATDSAASLIAAGKSSTVSIKNILVNIIPSDSISPFLQSDMLQIIFMGCLLGVAISLLSQRHPQAREAVACLNDLFSRITGLIIGVMPVAIFCSMAKMMIGMNLASLARIIVWVPVCYAGHFCMLMVYLLLLFAVGRLNPMKFVRGYSPVMLTAYSLASSSATMPVSLRQCEEKLGISRRVCSLSIPLGATINMDGSCVTLMISSLFMAKIFGVPVSVSMMATLVIAIMALSVGAPGVPGVTLVSLSMLLLQLGIPVEGVSLVMGLYSLVGMSQGCTNVTGDAVISTIVAKSEGLLDEQTFNAN